MTVTIDKKVIHIGWETAAAIMVFTVASTWGASSFVSSLKSDLKDIKVSVATVARRDSAYFIKVDMNRRDIDKLFLKGDSLKADVEVIKERLHMKHYSLTGRQSDGLIFKSAD